MPRASAFLFPLGVLALTRTLACADEDESFRMDVLYCENAIEHAKACCPLLAPLRQSCRHAHSEEDHPCSCSSSDEYTTTVDTNPTLSITESERLLESDCEAIRAQQGCEKLQEQIVQRTTVQGSNYQSACAGE